MEEVRRKARRVEEPGGGVGGASVLGRLGWIQDDRCFFFFLMVFGLDFGFVFGFGVLGCFVSVGFGLVGLVVLGG